MTTFASAALRARVAHPAARGWLLAVAVYFLAVFHRSSLGVAALLAEHRFGITSGQLGVFVMLQIGVYALMQVPTGVLVDRYGPRRMLVIASALMGVGQLLFALAPSYPMALVARALLGCGDAMTFISVLRFVAVRFSARRYPALVAITSVVGTVGNVFATLPLSIALAHFGWATSYATAALLSLVLAVVVGLLLDDRALPAPRLRTAAEVRRGLGSVSRRIALAWSEPGTRLGFWVHFACMSTATAFGVLWGHPYLVEGAGFSSNAADTILMIGVLASGVISPLVGWVIGRLPHLRVTFALVICLVTIAGWLVAIGTGNHPPQLYVAALYVFTMFGGPASMVAFAVVRDYNSTRVLGTASGVVNVGGFLAAVVISVVFGSVLGAFGGSTPHGMRFALLVPLAVQLVGTVRAATWARRMRAGILSRQRLGVSVVVSVSRRYWWDLPESDELPRLEQSLAG